MSDPGEIIDFDGLVWARGGIEDGSLIGADALNQINAKSLAPLIDHGDKQYMLKLGMAQEVVDFTQGFCVKPIHGSKGENVHIWDPNARGNKRSPGAATRSQVIKAITGGRDAIGSQDFMIQPFIPTATEDMGGVPHHKLMRLFAVINDQRKFQIIPSPYVMRPSMKIHGASDAINGLITFS